jgi:hypothetical protein
MARRDSLYPPRNLFDRFRPAPAIPGLISSLQAYSGLQAWAARTHRPTQSLGRLGSLKVRLAQTAAEVRQAQKLRYRVFHCSIIRRATAKIPTGRRSSTPIVCCGSRWRRSTAVSTRPRNSTSAA